MRTGDLVAASDMWRAGLSVREIADTFGMSVGAMWHYIRTNRDRFPHRKHHEDWWRAELSMVGGLSTRDAARRLGCSAETVSCWRRRIA